MLDLIEMQSVVKVCKYLLTAKYCIQLKTLSWTCHVIFQWTLSSAMPTTKYGSSHLERKMFLLLFGFSLFSAAGSSVKRCQISKDCEQMKDDFSENSGKEDSSKLPET